MVRPTSCFQLCSCFLLATEMAFNFVSPDESSMQKSRGRLAGTIETFQLGFGKWLFFMSFKIFEEVPLSDSREVHVSPSSVNTCWIHERCKGNALRMEAIYISQQ